MNLINNEILVVNSWNLTLSGIVAELKHNFDGLAYGSIIQSVSDNQKWVVQERILFHITISSQRRFQNEKTLYTHSSYASAKKMLLAEAKILEDEKNHIFQYRLLPVGSVSKPQKGDTLNVIC